MHVQRARIFPFRTGLLILLAVGLLGAASLRMASRRASPGIHRSVPHVVLVTVCSLRRDALGCYGHPGHPSPHMDALARGGVLYRDAVCQGCYTWPSMTSMTTSTYPSKNGCYSWERRLPVGLPTLPGILRASGFRTALFCGNEVLADPQGGWSRDFEVRQPSVHSAAPKLVGEDASALTDRALAWLDLHRTEPSFAWVHYTDLHYLVLGPTPDRPGGVARYVRGYEAALNRLDKQIGRLVDGVRALGLGDSVLVVTADHGEHLWDRLLCGFHAYFLREDDIRVPLLLSAPGRLPEGREVSAQVQALDIAPTVCDLVGVAAPSTFEGTSLIALAQGSGGGTRYAFSEHRQYAPDRGGDPADPYPWCLLKRVSVRTSAWKMVVTDWPCMGLHDCEVYDLRRDRREKRNLASVRGDVRRRLTARLDAWRRRLKLAGMQLYPTAHWRGWRRGPRPVPAAGT